MKDIFSMPPCYFTARPYQLHVLSIKFFVPVLHWATCNSEMHMQ